MKKKFSNEWTYVQRFVWIDEDQKMFFWSKSGNRDPSDAKWIHLVDDVISITANKDNWKSKFFYLLTVSALIIIRYVFLLTFYSYQSKPNPRPNLGPSSSWW